MLSPSSLKALRYIIQYGQFLNVIPFEWNPDTSTICFKETKSLLWIYSFITCYMWVEALYQFWMVCSEAGDDSVSFESYLKLIIHFASRLVATIFQTWSLVFGHKYASFCNQMFNMNQFFQEISKKRKTSHNQLDRCYKSLWGLFILSVIHPLTVVCAYIGDYQDRKYWQSNLPTMLYPYAIPLFAFDELILSIYSDLGVIVIVSPMFIQIVLTVEWLQIIRRNTGCEGFCRCYQILQLFNKTFNETFSFIWGYTIMSLFLISVLSCTSAIRLYYILPFPANLMFPIGQLGLTWVVVFVVRPGGHLKQLSEEIINEFGVSVQKKKRAAGKSLKSLRIEICSHFILKNSTVSTFLFEVANATVTILLMT
ncbi:unnamed protein product [Allacma fusca]|uniref:Uncharacterized protein n=1 Tax=Allacma fusca TaxID=39272 RepID=A0A8J2L279_9HEXA|nr:unnamed protein product [Allacma fusca]